MQHELKKRFDALQEERQPYDVLLTQKTAEQLNFRPGPEKWSITDVATHLFVSESMTLDFLRKFDFNVKDEQLGLKSKLRSLMLRMALRSNRKFKAPSVVRRKMEGTKIDSPANLSAQWELLRLGLEDYLNNFPPSQMNKFVFVHPRAGKFDILQTMDFLLDHQKHHLIQLNAILSDENFPLI